ncbi:MAG: aminopeptidase P family protein [Lachnospiraceae bacterium]|nr:aminopeptidase P family protein [Lachnospiraceae bacterium]
MRNEIVKLQELMKQENIDYYYVVTSDYHGSEYTAPYFSVREYLSGFTGSAGSLIITRDECYLWTDGRYFVQAKDELEGSGITLMKMGEKGVPNIPDFLAENMNDGETLAFDGRTVAADICIRINDKLKGKDVKIIKDIDLGGRVYDESGVRPELKFSEVNDYPITYAGVSRGDKIAAVRAKMDEDGIVCYVITSLDEIAWLFNLRGHDVPMNPVFMSYAVIYGDKVSLYVNLDSVDDELKAALKNDGIDLYDYSSFYEDLKNIDAPFYLDKSKANSIAFGYAKASGGGHIRSLIALMKAVKNDTELEGIRDAHIKDAVAYVRFLTWLNERETDRFDRLVDDEGNVLTEIGLSDRLEAERKKMEGYVEPSFDPISAIGEHGAIIHYSADEESDAEINTDTFLLMDTGSQFMSGTTDITRTTALGDVTPKMKELYTAVLKGNLRLMNTRFTKGSRGENLDIVARTPLWELGYDFKHGTGHGVGCYLNVHESPVAIRNKIFDDRDNSCELSPGMIVSNEPGVYIEGEFGIRLENLLEVVHLESTDYAEFYGFRPLTLVPFDKNSILFEQMSTEEKEMLNDYHILVYNTLKDYLEDEADEDVLDFLFDATRPVR